MSASVGSMTARASFIFTAIKRLIHAEDSVNFNCKSLFTNNMVDDKKQREITEKLN